MSELITALKEYDKIVKAIKEDYTQEELTVKAIRKDHKELNFMDDEELNDLINNANMLRTK